MFIPSSLTLCKTAFALSLTLGLAACSPSASPSTPSSESAPTPRLPGLTQSAYAQVAGEKVYYEVGGQGTPVLLVHAIGGGNSSHLWQENTALLAKTHRVYAFDWPGFARSGAKNQQYTNELYVGVLRRFLKEVVKAPAAVISAGFAADYTIRVAAENPELITRMILSDPNGYVPAGLPENATQPIHGPADANLYAQYITTPVGQQIFDGLRSMAGINFFLENFVYLDKGRITPAITSVFQQNLESANKQFAVFSFFSGYLAQPIADLWPRTKQPTFIVWGKDDTFTSISYADPLLKARPDVKLETLTGRALTYNEDATRFNALAEQFLK